MNLQSLSPELRLLIATARRDLRDQDVSLIAEATPDIGDWDALIEGSLRHSTMPLLYRHLLATCPDAVPAPAMERLKGLFYKNVARNTFLVEKLFSVLDSLASHGIHPLLYKGPAIAVSLYGDPALRRFDDLDFLLRPEDIRRARDILIASGFVPHIDLTDAEARAYLRQGWEAVFKKPDEEYSIELDTGVAPRYFCFDLGERLWEETHTVRLSDRVVHTPSPENLFLLLCAHGAKHLWERLVWAADIAALTETEEAPDWPKALELARRTGGLRMCLLGLQVAHDIFGVKLPRGIVERVRRDPIVPRLSFQMTERLLGGVPGPVRHREQILFHLLVRERIRDRLGYCFRLAVTPSYADWKSFSLPPALFPLYYVTRPFRLAWKPFRAKKEGPRERGPDTD